MQTKLLSLLFFIIVINGQFGSNLGPSIFGDECCEHNKIVVSGQGVSSGQPDIAKISVRFEVRAPTAEAAVSGLTQKVRSALSIILQFGLPNGSYETLSLYVNPEYNYQNGKSSIVGQIASQSLVVTVKNLDQKGTRVAKLVDLLAAVDGIQISSISFDIEDKTKLQTDARAKAYADAKSKAQDYAGFAKLKVGRALTIDDFIRVQSAPIQSLAKFSTVAADSSVPTSIQIGQLQVNYSLTITFQLGL